MKKRTFNFLILTLALIPLTGLYANTELDDTSPQLLIKGNQFTEKPALLMNSKLSGEVNGLVASMTIRQEFRNTSNEWVNGRYVFPLPNEAVVDSLTLTNEDRVLNGIVKEKEEAKKEFQQAKAAGKRAGLLEQNRPNLFAMSMANIAPQSTVTAKVTWVQKIDYEGGVFSLSLPTTLTPRFIPGKNLQISLEDLSNEANESNIQLQYGWSFNTDEVLDASEITPPQVIGAETMASHRINMDITLNAGIPLDKISSTSHAINFIEQGSSYRIQFQNKNELMDRDVLLQWQPSAHALPKAAVFSEQKNDAYYHMIMINPPIKNIVSTLPKDVTFIIDTSGSMSGNSMIQAKNGLLAALNQLSKKDRFNIIEFNSSANQLYKDSNNVNDQSLHEAKNFVTRLQANGGTQMMAALQLAFSQKEHEEYLRQIIFITDGAVGNEKALFSFINQRLGKSRLFTVGIGSAPNMHFMEGAAKYGRGTSTHITNLSEVDSKMIRLFEKLTYPVMRDIRAQWPEDMIIDAYPENIPDLYVAEPIMLIARSDKPIDQIKLKGQIAEQSWQQKLEINEGTTATADNINKIWALDKVNALLEKSVLFAEPLSTYRNDIVKIGVENQIVTKFTSFVAVEEEISRPAHLQAKDKQIANLMPKGSTMNLPQTATPATLQMILGVLLTMIALFKKLLNKQIQQRVTL